MSKVPTDKPTPHCTFLPPQKTKTSPGMARGLWWLSEVQCCLCPRWHTALHGAWYKKTLSIHCAHVHRASSAAKGCHCTKARGAQSQVRLTYSWEERSGRRNTLRSLRMKFPILSTRVINYLVSVLWMTIWKKKNQLFKKRIWWSFFFFLALNHAYIPQMKMYRTCWVSIYYFTVLWSHSAITFPWHDLKSITTPGIKYRKRKGSQHFHLYMLSVVIRTGSCFSLVQEGCFG